MKTLTLTFILLLNISSLFGGLCDETRSYGEKWIKQAREREAGRAEREKYYKSLTNEQRNQISDFEVYPTLLMTCGMGFSEGLAKVWVSGKAGFIDANGKIIIKTMFADAGRFSQGLAPVEFSDGRWGYINSSGTVVIKPIFEWAFIFREDKALVKNNGKWGYINKSGEVVIPYQFDHANSFSEELAHVQIMKDKLYSGYINKKGELIIPLIYNGGDDFFNGTSIIDVDVKDTNGRYKYTESFLIDRTGRKLEEFEGPRMIKTPNFLDKTDAKLVFKDHKTGYSDKNGKVIWKPSK